MKIEFSQHALKQLKRRGITENQVKEALLKGQERRQQPHGTIKCVYTKKLRELVAIYFQNKDNYLIVTAYYEN